MLSSPVQSHMLRPQDIDDDVEGGAPTLPSLSGEQPPLPGSKLFTPARIIAFLVGLQVVLYVMTMDSSEGSRGLPTPHSFAAYVRNSPWRAPHRPVERRRVLSVEPQVDVTLSKSLYRERLQLWVDYIHNRPASASSPALSAPSTPPPFSAMAPPPAPPSIMPRPLWAEDEDGEEEEDDEDAVMSKEEEQRQRRMPRQEPFFLGHYIDPSNSRRTVLVDIGSTDVHSGIGFFLRRYPAQFGEVYGFDCRAGGVMPPEVTDVELESILQDSRNNGMAYDVEGLLNMTLMTPAVLGYPELTHQSPPTIGLTTLLRALQLTEEDFVVLRVAVGHCGIGGSMLASVLGKWMDDATHDLVDELFLELDYVPDKMEAKGSDRGEGAGGSTTEKHGQYRRQPLSKQDEQDSVLPLPLTLSNATDLLLRVQRAGVTVHPWRWPMAAQGDDDSSSQAGGPAKTMGRDGRLAASVSR